MVLTDPKTTHRSRNAMLLAAGGIFALMLVLNLLTPYICDDFTYRLNFSTGEPLASFREIFASMQAHSHKMNGRLISHGLAQVFMLLPPLVFDIANTAVFTGAFLLLTRLCGGQKVLTLAGSFCLFWLFTPAFGQVVLWQVGALNYFWSLAALLLFIAPEFLLLMEGRQVLRSPWQWAAFCIYGFFFGWYNEIASFVGICMVPCLFALGLWLDRQKLRLHRLLPVVCAVLGYAVMLMMPAQAANKSGVLTLELIFRRFLVCSGMLVRHQAILLMLCAILFILGIRKRLSRKTLLTAGLLALAGVCANYMPIAASYYPERCMCTTVLMLVMACMMLASELLATDCRRLITIAAALVLLLTVPFLVRGTADVASCHRQHAQREKAIAAALERGDREVTASTVIPATRWSGYWDVRDLTADPTTWPNRDMARYYGLDALIGQ